MHNKSAGMEMTLLGVILAFAALYITFRLIQSFMAPAEGLVDTSTSLADTLTVQGFSYDVASDGTLSLSSGLRESVKVASAPATPLSGSIAEKAANAAKEAGLSKADAEIVLKLISQESSFRHCCAGTGKNTAGTCSATSDESCGEGSILTSGGALAGAGTSKGAMQLNSGVHPAWFTDKEDDLCSQSKQKADCLIKQNAGCMGKTAYNVDCNIRLGVRYLIWAKVAYGGGKHYSCHTPDKKGLPGCNYDVTYSGWDAALRTYNGWGCPKDNVQCRYVDHVNGKDISSYQGTLDAAYS